MLFKATIDCDSVYFLDKFILTNYHYKDLHCKISLELEK